MQILTSDFHAAPWRMQIRPLGPNLDWTFTISTLSRYISVRRRDLSQALCHMITRPDASSCFRHSSAYISLFNNLRTVVALFALRLDIGSADGLTNYICTVNEENVAGPSYRIACFHGDLVRTCIRFLIWPRIPWDFGKCIILSLDLGGSNLVRLDSWMGNTSTCSFPSTERNSVPASRPAETLAAAARRQARMSCAPMLLDMHLPCFSAPAQGGAVTNIYIAQTSDGHMLRVTCIYSTSGLHARGPRPTPSEEGLSLCSCTSVSVHRGALFRRRYFPEKRKKSIGSTAHR